MLILQLYDVGRAREVNEIHRGSDRFKVTYVHSTILLNYSSIHTVKDTLLYTLSEKLFIIFI